MSDSIGKKIKAARIRKRMRGEDLGDAVGLTKGTISKIENDELKSQPDPRTLIRISDALNAPEILLHHCETCQIRRHIMLRVFPELNNIRKDPLAIVNKLRKEMQEAIAAADELGDQYTRPDFKSSPEYRGVFAKAMEQIVDVERVIETLKFQLVLDNIHTQEEIQQVYEQQQRKCEDHGHHKPTGTEG